MGILLDPDQQLLQERLMATKKRLDEESNAVPTDSSSQIMQVEALQHGQSGSASPPVRTTTPVSLPLPDQVIISPEAQEAQHQRTAQLITKLEQQDIQKATHDFDLAKADYSKAATDFSNRWDSRIQNNEFIGTKAEYERYRNDIARLNDKNQRLVLIGERLNQTITASNTTVEAENRRFFEKNVKLADDRYISKIELERIRQESPAMHEILINKGITGAENFIDEYNNATGEKKYDLLRDNGFIEKGARYVGNDEQGNPLFMTERQANTVDIIKHFNNSPSLALAKKRVTAEQLREIGYTDDQVQRFVDTVAEGRSSGIALPGESGFMQQWNRDYIKAEMEFNKIADKIQADNPKASKKQLATLMLLTPEYERLQELNEQVPDPMMTEFSIAKRAVVTGGSMIVFSPARTLLPEVKVRDISGMEWAVGGAQAVLLTAPFVGIAARGATGSAAIALREVDFSLKAGAAAVFTKETVDNWEYLKDHPWQAGFCIALDALIIGSAAGSLKRLAATVRAEQLARIESQARRIVVDRFMDSATGRIDPHTKRTFTRIPTAPLEPGKYLPVQYETRLPSLKKTMQDAAKAIRTRDVALLRDAGRRMQYLALKDPYSPMAKLLGSRGKQLESNADDWIELSKRKVPPKERTALDDAIHWNQSKADEIERALKRGIKNPDTRRIAEETLKVTRKQLKTQIRERTQQLPMERVIMPSEQGKDVPATRKQTSFVDKTKTPDKTKAPDKPSISRDRPIDPAKDPRIQRNPSRLSDIQVTIRPTEGGEAYVGYVLYPTHDPEGQRKYLEALRNTYTRQGYVFIDSPVEDINLTDDELARLKPDKGFDGVTTRRITKSGRGLSRSDKIKQRISPTLGVVLQNKIKTSLKHRDKLKPAFQYKTQLKPQQKTKLKTLTSKHVKPVPIIPKIRTTTKFKNRIKPKSMSESVTRELIAGADTKLGWVQGSLNVDGKKLPVSHVVYGKAGHYNKATIVGKVPEGVPMVTGKGQAYKSIKLTKGIPPDKPVMIEGGAVDPTVIPDKRGVVIRFIKDKDANEWAKRRNRIDLDGFDTRQVRIRTVLEKETRRKEKPQFRINRNRKASGGGRGIDLGADIVRDRRGRHLRL